MATIQKLNTRLQLRRADISIYDSHPDFIPLNGEVCIVDDADGELKLKIGDGDSTFQDLDWTFAKVISGYFYQGEFYYNEAHTQRVGKFKNTIYIELIKKAIYFYDGQQYLKVLSDVGPATPTEAGIMKLYTEVGHNTDGTMDQNSITNTVTMTAVGETIIFNQPIIKN